MSKTNGPFCWQNKATLRGIRESLDGDGGLASVLSVYHALTEIASDFASDEFTTMQSHIGKLAGGLSTSTVKRCIKELRDLNVISYELSRLRGPLRFILNRDRSSLANDGSQIPNDGSRLTNDSSKSDSGKVVSSRRTLEESSEEDIEAVGRRRKRAKRSPDLLTLPSIPTELDTPAFRTAWDEWMQHRKEKGEPLTPSAASKQLKKVAELGEARAIAAIDRSIFKNWKGIFEEQGLTLPPEQIVPSTPNAAAPDGWQGILLDLYPDATVMPWDQLTQLHPEVADQVMNVIAERKRDGTAIVQNTL